MFYSHDMSGVYEAPPVMDGYGNPVGLFPGISSLIQRFLPGGGPAGRSSSRSWKRPRSRPCTPACGRSRACWRSAPS